MRPTVTTLVDLLRAAAGERPADRAFVFLREDNLEEEPITYGELDRRARAIAALLLRSAKPGDRAALLFPNGLDYVASYFGCLYAGIIAVPAYPPVPRTAARVLSIFADAQPVAVLAPAMVVPFAKALLGAGADSLAWLSIDALAPGLEDDWAPPAIDGGSLAFLQYTSGSTSTPKGVMVSHGNLLYNLLDIATCVRHQRDSVVVSWAPMLHDMGLIYGVLAPIFSGCLGVLMSPMTFVADPLQWLRAMTTYRGTHSAVPNFAYELCLKKITDAELATLDLSPWEVSTTSAEPVRADTLAAFTRRFAAAGLPATTLAASYGLAEATLGVAGQPYGEAPTIATLDAGAVARHRVVEAPIEAPIEGIDGRDGAVRRFVGCGRSAIGGEIAIVDPGSLRACGSDEIGEIWVRSDSVAQGYWNRPDESAATFRAVRADDGEGPFLRTGDLGFLRGGHLFVTGRLKDVVIIDGRNHYPQDLELTVDRCHPAIRPGGGAVFSVDDGGEERVVVVHEVSPPKTGGALDGEAIALAVRHAIAEQHDLSVHAVVLLPARAVLKTTSGKIQRRACRAAYLDGTLPAVHTWIRPAPAQPAALVESPARPASAEVAVWLRDAIADAAGIERRAIDMDAPFVSHGLKSVQLVSLAGDLQRRLGQRVAPTVFWEHPTIARLSRHLAGDDTAAVSSSSSVSTGSHEPIAIVGIGCRVPGADGPAAYWSLLRGGVDAVSEVPADRWDADALYDADASAPGKMTTRWGGFLRDIDGFDPLFFGISPREAVHIDPQQRLMLEVTWEACEDARLIPAHLAGTDAGVFVGVSSNDYGRMQAASGCADGHATVGSALSIVANRISYQLDLRGPSVAIDTACSSSLVAVHLACDSLRAGRSSVAIAGGVNVILSPETTIAFSKGGYMAADGRCKAFDAAADGYVRSEGAGAVVLKTLSRALADGDRIYAVIRGSAVNQDGRSNGLAAPNPQAQEQVLRAAYADAGVSPGDVQYVEAHGTGTPLGDPIEIGALGAVLATARPDGARCAVGSVKTNIGHLESAAGIAGLIKVALALTHREIPASLHFQQPNPLIPFELLPLDVPRATAPWAGGAGRRLAGVSSFGFGGTNAHVVVEEAPVPSGIRTTDVGDVAERPIHVLALSARSPGALRAQAARLADDLRARQDGAAVADVAFTANTARSLFEHRLAVAGATSSEIATALRTAVPTGPAGRPTIAFLFTGGGAQYLGMGRALYQTQPVFRAAIDRCEAILAPLLGRSLTGVLFASTDDDAGLIDRIDVALPALFAVEWSLTELWRTWGIVPDIVLGHSLGELVAACVAGVFSLDDGLTLVTARSRLMHEMPGAGAMVAVHASEARVLAALGDAVGVSIAAINGPEQVAIAGDEASVLALAARLDADGIKTKRLRVSHASHSPLMDPMLAPFERIAAGLTYAAPRIPVVSNLSGAIAGDKIACASYWPRHVRSPVRFADGMRALIDAGVDTFIEVGPHPVLVAMGADSVADDGVAWLPSLRRGEDDWATIAATVAALFTRGAPIDWRAFDAPYARQLVDLPTYPWQRQRCWFTDVATAKPTGALISILDGDVVAELQTIAPFSAEELPVVQRVLDALRARAQDDALDGELAGCLYAPAWRPIPLVPLVSAGGDAGHWIVLAGALGDRIADALEAAGGTCSRAPRDAADVRAWCAARIAASGPARGIVHVDASAEHLVAWAQALDAIAAPVFVVTQGAVSTRSGDPVTAPEQALLAGIGRVVALESPERWGGIIDVPAPADDATVTSLAAELLASDCDHAREDHVALRPSGRFVERLGSHRLRKARTWSTSGSALVTGGLGGVGLQVARWLASRGVRHLVLTSRGGVPSAEASAVLEALRGRGVSVRIAAVDVADATAMAALIADVDATQPAISAVFHAAGVVDRTPIEALDPERLRSVLRPKVEGTLVLDALTRSRALDAFVNFSSIAAVWGSGGQAAYTAANAFQDAWAKARRAEGRAAFSIDWGAWQDGGMVTEEARAELERRGVHVLPPALALRALARILDGDTAQVVVAKIDWPQFRAVLELRGERSLLADMPQAPAVAAVATQQDFLRDLERAAPRERRHRLERWLQEVVARVLRLADPALVDRHRGFFDLGMDSLLAVEVRKHVNHALGTSLRATAAFDHPNVAALAEFLLGELSLTEIPARAAPVAIDLGNVPDLPGPNDLSADELLEQQLREIESL